MNRVIRYLATRMAITAVSMYTLATSAAPPDKTVVLVHGAWADGSSWNKVIPYLLDAGLHVVAVQNPLKSLPDDVANVTRVINDQAGSVVLVGHSYGGMVISEAGNHPKVRSLVYVAAFSPEPGQSVNDILAPFPKPPWVEKLHVDAGGFVTWPADLLQKEFASGLPVQLARTIASTQHPTFHGVNNDKVGTTLAYSTRPSWSVVSSEDRIIPAPLQMHFADVMKAKVVTVKTGHLPMLADPKAVARTIVAASRGN